ncbi:hypothetical protein [Streptomyces xiaopingdaonensis]|uniref:hypothetical protein n=1 Tax=Streptomyces xiaopingdaonensis TaxID=1565415 RepID=UPI0002DB2C3A|nr:hypothetical protein [Streptomyces xiaopingdaonensis]
MSTWFITGASRGPPFGIRSMVVEPGVFRTDFLGTSSLSTVARRLPAYDGTPAHATLDWSDTANHTQLGDPVKGAALIHEVTTGDDLPGRLPLGRDAIERRQATLRTLRDDLATWQNRSAATACDDAA